AQRLVEQGYLSYDDLSVVEPDALMEMGGMTAEQVDAIVEQADERALVAEKAADDAKKLKRETAMNEAAAAAKAAASPPPTAPPEQESAAVEETSEETVAGEGEASAATTGDEPAEASEPAE